MSNSKYSPEQLNILAKIGIKMAEEVQTTLMNIRRKTLLMTIIPAVTIILIALTLPNFEKITGIVVGMGMLTIGLSLSKGISKRIKNMENTEDKLEKFVKTLKNQIGE